MPSCACWRPPKQKASLSCDSTPSSNLMQRTGRLSELFVRSTTRSAVGDRGRERPREGAPSAAVGRPKSASSRPFRGLRLRLRRRARRGSRRPAGRSGGQASPSSGFDLLRASSSSFGVVGFAELITFCSVTEAAAISGATSSLRVKTIGVPPPTGVGGEGRGRHRSRRHRDPDQVLERFGVFVGTAEFATADRAEVEVDPDRADPLRLADREAARFDEGAATDHERDRADGDQREDRLDEATAAEH